VNWELVDEGWGRRAAEFASLAEPANCREYVSLHNRLGIGSRTRLMDMACGSGLAIELANLLGASCAGIDASKRLVAVARDRSPDSDIRVGDMNALPWEDGEFDVVTSFRGIWATTPDAVGEAHRVLKVGGRIGLTVWGNLKKSPGIWALAPLALASDDNVENQAAMVSLGRPGVAEALLDQHGFVDIERFTVPFVWEFPDVATYVRAISSSGPAYEAIANVGQAAFAEAARAFASDQVREGLPLRAEIDVAGYVATKP
jgi:SAM-dependent methyltransferase